ncbi:hypothetical protein C0584_02280 [Candidatus Parcubacteria bacterium]|nr:MAG: hypothetical protein C0584_02280 [Candidatus Parcubacteria bacterium]
MKIEDIKFFKTKEGLALIEKYKELSTEELEMLSFNLAKNNVPHYSYLITLLKLRKKSINKFSKSEEMFFDSLGLEMSTDERVSKHIAERFKRSKKVLEIGCGLGGNTIFLANNSRVLAIDRSETSVEIARHNTKIYGVENEVDFKIGDALDYLDENIDAVFIDPMRAREGKTKTRSFLNSEPNIIEALPRIMKHTKNIGIKVSPAFDYKELKLLPEAPEVEVIALKNENKVAMLWFGDLRMNKSKATIISEKNHVEITDKGNFGEIIVQKEPKEYIYEPNKAIIKAHLIDELADEYNLSKLNKNIAFLSSAKKETSEDYKFKTYKLVDYQPFSLKSLKKNLKARRIERIEIVNRGTPINAGKLAKELKLKEGGTTVVLIGKLRDDKNYYFITEKTKSD